MPIAAVSSVASHLARLLLVAVVLATPWMYGGVFESTHGLIAVTLTVALALTLPAAAARPQRLTLLHFVLLAAIGWGSLQLVPLPKPVARVFSPGAVELRDAMLPSAESPDAALLTQFALPPPSENQTLSLRPSATRFDLAWLILASAAFFLAHQHLRTRRSLIWLCGCVAVNGTALALFGMLQKLTWNGQIYWIGYEPSRSVAFAAFGNRNNAAGYLNLCLAATIGLAIWAMRRDREQARLDRSPLYRSTPQQRILQLVAQLDAVKLAAYVAAICIAAAVLCTLSRGGGIALVGGGLITALGAARTRRGLTHAAWLATALVAALGLVGWTGMYQLLEDRFLTLSEPEQLMAGGRWPNWIDALHAVPDFPWTGSGLATYRDIYHQYQHRYAPSWYYFAENQYVQAVVEAGLIGLGLLTAAVGLLFAACWRQLRQPRHDRDAAEDSQFAAAPAATRQLGKRMAAQVGLFAVASQAIHATFDFGLYVPANMLLLATLAALPYSMGAASSRRTDEEQDRRRHPPRRDSREDRAGGRTRLLVTGVAGLLLVGGTWSCGELRTAARAATALRDTDFSQTPSAVDDVRLAAAMEQLGPLTRDRPDDAELHYQLAKLGVLRFRVAELARLRASAPVDVPLDQLWERTSPAALHGVIYRLAASGERQRIAELQNDPQVTAFLHPAIGSLLRARDACPLLAKVHLRLARLAPVAAWPASDKIHLLRARRAEPSSSYTRTRCGLLHAQAGRLDEACQDWRGILAIDANQLETVWPWAQKYLDDEQIADQMMPPQPDLLLDAAGLPSIEQESSELKTMLLERAAAVLLESELPADENAYLTGQVLIAQNRPEAAVEPMATAVELKPRDLERRYQLAVLLRDLGRIKEAHDHAAVCARLGADAPQFNQFNQLLQELVRLEARGNQAKPR